MSWNETIDNYLYDEENEYTQADDLWDDFFVERRDEIDERLERLRYSDEILAIYKYLHR